jgi:hypothetical protein
VGNTGSPETVLGAGQSNLFQAEHGHGDVAEWQTRTVQVRVSERTWGFNSPHPHQSSAQGFAENRGALIAVRDQTTASDQIN